MQNGANLIEHEVRIYLCMILHHVSMAVLLQFIASRDLETVKNVVPGNSSLKLINLAARDKVMNSH